MQRFDVGGPMVGRAQHLEQVDALVAHERLVSVVGPPGIGKSRLAGLVAERAAARWSGGAVGCSLAHATTAEQACEAVAAALEIPLTSTSTLAAAWRRLGQALTARGHTLVLLDDVERLAGQADATVGALLAAAPDAHVLVTSRERLRLHQEVVVQLGPLTDAESLALLLARARASAVPLDEASPALVGIAERLDGLPLALELAAARLRVMGPLALLERLDRQLDLLTSGMRDSAPRHASLRAALEASWSLLSTDEQATLACLGAFPASFTLEAAEAIVMLPGTTAALDAIQSLVDKSLVRAPAAGSAGRLALLGSVAELAREQLEASGQVVAAASRHASWFAAQALERTEAFDHTGDAAALRWLVEERDNLSAAARSALDADGEGAAIALPSLLALERLAGVRGRLGQSPLLEQALARRHDAGVAPTLVAAALLARAAVRRAAGAHGDAADDGMEAEAIATAAGDRVLAARALLVRAIAWQHAGRAAEAAALLERARDVFVEAGAGWLAGFALGNLAFLRQEQGRLDDAEGAYTAALQAFSDAGHERYRLLFSGFHGTLRWEQGRLDDAQALLRAAADGLAALGDVRFGALFLAGAAAAEAALGFTADAAEGLARAQAALEETADTARLAAVSMLEGVLEVARARELRRTGNDDAATQLRAQARARLRDDALGARRERSDEVRFAARVLARTLGEADDVTEPQVPSLSAPNTLAVGADASFFITPAGSRADLSRQRAPRRLLARLLEQRVAAPGEPLTVEALVAAGWPGERIIPRAAANRVYVALTALRKLGLAGLLVRTADGYLLDPAVAVVTRDDEPPG
ncbi:MAG: AAA family ATPase [Deltaproteobacteria bacterium]|nr:AAA family ATPase [Deltaproteobacteria bacterium]